MDYETTHIVNEDDMEEPDTEDTDDEEDALLTEGDSETEDEF